MWQADGQPHWGGLSAYTATTQVSTAQHVNEETVKHPFGDNEKDINLGV